MQIEITKDATHHTNSEYPVVKVRWNGEDLNFQTDEIGPNWTPRDDELIDLVVNMMLVSPTFDRKLRNMVHALQKR